MMLVVSREQEIELMGSVALECAPSVPAQPKPHRGTQASLSR